MDEMKAADAAVAKAQRDRAQLVLKGWLEKIARPLDWTDDWFLGSWDEDRHAAARIIGDMKTPPEVTLEDCPVAQAALEGFRGRYAAVHEPTGLRTLKTDQQMLRAAVEAIREHARIIE